MSEAHRFKELVTKLDPASDDVIAVAGRGRGRAMDIGIAALICAGAPSEAERAECAAVVNAAVESYRDVIVRARDMASPILGDRVMPERLKVRAFLERVVALPKDGAIDRAMAISVSEEARDVVVPSINRIMGEIQKIEIEAIDARIVEMSRRTALTERMIAEMDRIGKTIGLIAINASVEAARAGGESGRAFQVIAQEVRSLATQSAERLARLRQEMGGAEGAGSGRSGPAPSRAGRPSMPENRTQVPATSGSSVAAGRG